MTNIIVASKDIVSLVGGGTVSSLGLETLRAQTGPVVAADGGARHLLSAGLRPDAVIGDFDSLDPASRDRISDDRLHHVGEQDSTDFEKSLSRIHAPLVLGLGFMGPRTDHKLAAFHGLMRCADQFCILLEDTQVVFLCPPRLTLTASPGDLVSLFPMTGLAAQSTGLHWALDGLDLAPGRMIGTSNRAALPEVTITCDRPGLLVILPGPALPAAVSALLACRATWPVRAG